MPGASRWIEVGALLLCVGALVAPAAAQDRTSCAQIYQTKAGYCGKSMALVEKRLPTCLASTFKGSWLTLSQVGAAFLRSGAVVLWILRC
eukprot:5545997-Pyramimonas_sp.AAC.1